MSIPGKSIGYKQFQKAQTGAIAVEQRQNEDLEREVEQMEQKIQEAQKRFGTLSKAAGPKEERILSSCTEEILERRRNLRGIFREQKEPFDKFLPVEEKMIFTFRRLEELVKNTFW